MRTDLLGLGVALAASPGAHAQSAPCFTVDGEKASVHNIFKDGKPQVAELDMPSISTMASRAPRRAT